MSELGFELFRRGSSEYIRALDVFNGSIDASPEAVMVPRSTEELSAGLAFATDQGIPVSLRAGGHGVAGRAVQGRWVVDLRSFRGVVADDDLLVVGAGNEWADLDRYAHRYGVGVPGGTVSSTGVAGLTLGGGVGWLLPQHGLTCDRLVGVQGVAGDGTPVHLDDESDPEAMALLRGAGHGLLAVTRFVFDPVPIPRQVTAGSIYYPLADAGDVIDFLVRAEADCPETIGWSPALMTLDGVRVLSVDGVSFADADFGSWVQETCKIEPLRSTVRVRTYPEAQAMLDNPARWGQRCAWRSLFTTSLDSEAIDFLVRRFEVSPSEGCQIFVERMGRAARSPARRSVFPLRWASYDVLIAAGWRSPDDDARHLEWLAATKEGLAARLPAAPIPGTYSNYADRSESVAVLGEAEIELRGRATARLDPAGTLCWPGLTTSGST